MSPDDTQPMSSWEIEALLHEPDPIFDLLGWR